MSSPGRLLAHALIAIGGLVLVATVVSGHGTAVADSCCGADRPARARLRAGGCGSRRRR